MTDSIDLLRELTEADGVPGFEDEVRKVFAARLAGRGDLTTDRLGSVVCRIPGRSEGPRVMLDSHLDEIGFIIQHVLPNGFLKFLPLGGWWGHTLPSQRVRVWAGDGRKIDGVIASTPPHFLSEEKRKKVLDPTDMFVDIGASNAEEAAAWGVRPGNWAVPASPFTRMRNDKLLMAKAFDDRVGCGVCIESALEVRDHPNTVFAVGAVQEELGWRGATTVTRLVDPDVAIVLEGPPADDTPGFRPEESQGGLGKGVQIRPYDPKMVGNPRLVDLALATAREEGIPHQVAVRSSGSTDSAVVHLTHHGVATLVLGVPARYIHAHVGIIHLDDYRAAVRLVVALLGRLDDARVRSLYPGIA